jgi:IucA / IucC family/Ferric iron reductase FhuF-like transporter
VSRSRLGSPTRREPGVTLRAVRQWAREHGIGRAKLARAHDDAFLVAVSRLLEAIYREHPRLHSALRRDETGRWCLDLGPTLRTPVSGPLPFRRLEVTGFPRTNGRHRPRALRTPRAFLTALRRSVKTPATSRRFPALTADFNNSFANLVLNRLLAQRLGAHARAIEPVYEGHKSYPFPALRIGPSVAAVVECSNLCRAAIDLPLAVVRQCEFTSVDFKDHQRCFAAWSGLDSPRGADPVIPLHPWQLRLSPIVREVVARGWIAILDERLEAVPLASQRTCRIVATGFDVKLPIDATLTSGERLLYPVNRANAPAVSRLARIFLEADGATMLDFQDDVASMGFAEPSIGSHLSAIIRAPIRQRAGEVVVPALNLWSGPERARALLDLRTPERAYDFFRAYCRVLMRGPVEFFARWGMAFEPHLQNVQVALRAGAPVRIVLRDLDSTILDPTRIARAARANGVELAAATWRHMPTIAIGGRRLAHAMLYGHLGAVMSYLVRHSRADLTRLAGAVDDTWEHLLAGASSPSARRMVREVRAHSNTVKAALRMRLARSAQFAFR